MTDKIKLLDIIVRVTGVEKSVVQENIDKVIAEILLELSANKQIYIPNLGSFMPKILEAKDYFIPSLSIKKFVEARVSCKFKLASKFKNKLGKLKNINMN
jgi:nucleoid DNA-binding protein